MLLLGGRSRCDHLNVTFFCAERVYLARLQSSVLKYGVNLVRVTAAGADRGRVPHPAAAARPPACRAAAAGLPAAAAAAAAAGGSPRLLQAAAALLQGEALT